MKKLIRQISFLMFLFILACSSDRNYSEKTIRIATLNCEFLWDGLEPEEGNLTVEFPHKGKPALAREHIYNIAEVIKSINADIINLAEVEGIAVLKFLNDTFLTDLKYYIGFIEGRDTYTGQDVAILSKFPINKIFRFDEKGRSGEIEKSVSKNYVADITVENTDITFIGIHLLSGPSDVSRIDERQAQADAIKQIALKKAKEGNLIVVLGDFNDYDGDTNCIDVNNNLPVSNVLNIIKESGNLVNTASLILKDQRYTSHWDKDNQGDVDNDELSSIDYILVSQDLFQNVESAEIYHNYNPLEVSDHFPVIVDLIISIGQ